MEKKKQVDWERARQQGKREETDTPRQGARRSDMLRGLTKGSHITA